MFAFKGRSVVVTGGTSGIGRAVAVAFAAAGARVIAAGLPDADQNDCDGIRFEALDVTDEAAVFELIGGMTDIDVIVNAAGIIRRDEEFDMAVFERVLNVNLTGCMRVCTAARAHLRQSRGCIVNIASMLTFSVGLACRRTVPAKAVSGN